MDRSFGLFGLSTLIFLIGGIAMSSREAPPVIQPLAFNHKAHAKETTCWDCHFICEKNRDEDGDVDCEACMEADGPFCAKHLECADHRLPGYPSTQVCLGCHEYDLLELAHEEASPDEAANERAQRKLLDFVSFDEYDEVEDIEPLKWQQVTRLSLSNVYFSHRTHALVAEIACEQCHGEVSQWETPPTAPAAELSMNWCLDCHEKNGATEDCLACHR